MLILFVEEILKLTNFIVIAFSYEILRHTEAYRKSEISYVLISEFVYFPDMTPNFFPKLFSASIGPKDCFDMFFINFC